MVNSIKPVHTSLFMLTLFAVIAGSSAIHALVGNGQQVFWLAMGVAAGMSFSVPLAIGNWRQADGRFHDLYTQMNVITLAVNAANISPNVALNLTSPAPESKALAAELESRALLDAIGYLLKRTEDDGSYHYEKSLELYQAGRTKRTAWNEFKKHVEAKTK